MQDLGLLFKVCFKQDFIGFSFGLTEDDGSSVSSSVQVNDISDDSVSVVIRAVKGQMLDSFRSSHISILN